MGYFLLLRIIPTSIQLALLFSGVRFVQGAGEFTKTPPSVLYVSQGGNATFTWDYHVDNRNTEFNDFSPLWKFYENASIPDNKGINIAFDNSFNNWTWEIGTKCPPRLLNPTRVFKKENATLVITNVTTADNGIYGCSLDFRSLLVPKTRKSQLIVTVHPQITITGDTSVKEYTNLTLNCSAVGPPTPNVTWINEAGVVLAQGIGSATLIVINITRAQSGTRYKCSAINNPNEIPVQKESNEIKANFPPEKYGCEQISVDCPGNRITVRSFATASPPASYYWFNPQKKSVGENITDPKREISVFPVENGNWTCHITNGIGRGIDCKFQVTVLSESDEKCKKGCTVEQIVGFVIGFIIALIIIAVVIWFILKRKKEKKELTTVEKVIIVIALLVAVAIIVIVIVFITKCP